MNRMPWVFGIVLALVAGLAIGYVAGSKAEPPERGPQAGPTASPQATPAPRAVDARVDELELEVTDLKADLARRTKEGDDLRAEIEALKATASVEVSGGPLHASKTPEEQRKSRDAAAKAIDELAKKGLFAFMSPENKDLMAQVQEGLKGAGELAVEFLAEMLAGKDSTKRFLAVSLLSELDIEKALPLYRKALFESEDDLVRRMASHSLATHKVEKALPDLMRAMKEDKDWGVRANSAYGVAKMGNKAGIDALVESYNDESHQPAERLGVLGGIADIADPSTAPLFRDLLAKSKDDTTLLLSIGAVEKMMDKSSLAPLQAIIQGSGSSLIKDPAKKAYNTIYGQEVYR